MEELFHLFLSRFSRFRKESGFLTRRKAKEKVQPFIFVMEVYFGYEIHKVHHHLVWLFFQGLKKPNILNL